MKVRADLVVNHGRSPRALGVRVRPRREGGMGTATVCAGATTFESIVGGFVRVDVAELAHAWHACLQGPPGVGGFRAWLAAREMVARRHGVGGTRSPHYGVAELARLLDVSGRTAAASVRRLVCIGLLAWSESSITFPSAPGDRPGISDTIAGGKGPVFIPRRLLRWLVRGARPALLATALGALLRCVSRRRAGFGARGRVAASWVARAFAVDLRRVKQARAELVALGWLSPESSDRWAINRWGAAWRVDLAWTGPRDDCHPGLAPEGVSLPPPESDPDPLRENLDPEPAGPGPAGTSLGQEEGELPAPDLRDVRPEDLVDTGRALELHRQAAARGRITASESDRVRFLSAVEHARAVGRRNPCGLLARIVSAGWWHLATQGDEDRAARRLREHGRAAMPPRSSWRAYVAEAAGASPPSGPPPVPARRPSSSVDGPPRQPTALADLLARLVAGPAS